MVEALRRSLSWVFSVVIVLIRGKTSMEKQKRGRVLLDDEGELYEELSHTHPQVRAAQYGCAGVIIAALIGLLGAIIVKIPDASGVPQSVLYIVVEGVLKNQGSLTATAPPTVVAGDGTASATPGTVRTPAGPLDVTRLSDDFRTQVMDEATRTALASSPNPQPTFTATASQTVPPTSTQSPTETPTSVPLAGVGSGIKRADLDSVFGVDNWACFPNLENAVVVIRIKNNLVVKSPVFQIDTFRGSHKDGQTAPSGIGGTAYLVGTVSQNECPQSQQSALNAWKAAAASDTQPFDRARIDALVGTNWKCVDGFPTAVRVVRLAKPIKVEYPVAVVDSFDLRKYPVGSTAPAGGGATLWLASSVPSDQCR